jgi:hypothetical protein
MRLSKVSEGHDLKGRLTLGLMRLVTRKEPADVVKMLMYRVSFLGKPLGALTQASMRGPSEWSVGEREIFAAFVSRLNQCVF